MYLNWTFRVAKDCQTCRAAIPCDSQISQDDKAQSVVISSSKAEFFWVGSLWDVGRNACSET